MEQERFYTLLGTFIIGAFCLIVLGGYIIFQQYIHSETETYVMFFDGSLKGLKANSPITYRGVKVGQVNRIEITESRNESDVFIPVYAQFFVEKRIGEKHSPLEILIRQGYSASISKPNLLTGTADIELIQGPATGIARVRKKYRGYRIFPTTSSKEKQASLDDAIKAAEKMLNQVTKLVKSPEVKDTISAAKNMATSFDKLATSVNKQLPIVVAYFNQSLQNISGAAYATKTLTEFLSRHPESLLKGKP